MQRAKSSIVTFCDYLKEKEYPKITELTLDNLPNILMDFYTSLRKTDGDIYKLQSIKSIHAGINCYMKAEKGIDIISGDAFVKANEMFLGVGKQLRMSALGSTKSTPVISEEDLSKISQFFQHDIMNEPNPKNVQECLIFYKELTEVNQLMRQKCLKT